MTLARFASPLWILGAALLGCSQDSAAADEAGDAGTDAVHEPEASDTTSPPLDSGPHVRCTLDTGNDPVALCTQKVVLAGVHDFALLSAGAGVAQSWDSSTLAIDVAADGGAPLHSPRDDAAYAAAAARYHASAAVYGDDELTPTLDQDLLLLGAMLPTELGTLPETYDGELYANLRTTAGTLRALGRDDVGNPVDAIAEAYGRAILDAWFHALPTEVDGGAPDAGDGGPVDAGAESSGTDGSASAATNGTLGATSGGAIAYAPADAATGAVALLDMAARHATDDPALASKLEGAAVGVLDRLWSRARDPSTGLFHRALVTGASPDEDTVVDPGDGLPSDALLTDVQATVALAFSRAAELAVANPVALAGVDDAVLANRVDAILGALHLPAIGLVDADSGGYFAGYVPSTKALLDARPTRGNALLFGVIHRTEQIGTPTYLGELPALRRLLTQSMPAHSSLLTVVFDQHGYLPGSSRKFDVAAPDAGVGPRPASYAASTIASACEGLDAQWLGVPH